MTAAQKAAKANFKKAIEYRKKTGVSLKEAFAHVYGKKVGAAPKKKAAKKAVPKKAAKKVAKKAAPKKAARKVVKKAAPKRSVSLHKDTKSHNVNIRVISGLYKIVGISSNKYFVEYVTEYGYKQREYYNKLPKNYYKGKDGYYYVTVLTNKGTSLVPIKYSKNEKFVRYY